MSEVPPSGHLGAYAGAGLRKITTRKIRNVTVTEFSIFAISINTHTAASKQKRDNSKGFDTFYLRAKARIWP